MIPDIHLDVRDFLCLSFKEKLDFDEGRKFLDRSKTQNLFFYYIAIYLEEPRRHILSFLTLSKCKPVVKIEKQKSISLQNMHYNMKIRLTTLLMGFLCWSLMAQETTLLEKSNHINIDFIDDKLQIRSKHFTSLEFIKDINLHANDVVYYSGLTPLVNFDAYVKTPNKKGKYKKNPVKIVEDKDIVESGIFYGGYKKKEFVYPSPTPLSVGVLDYTLNITEPHFLAPFYFDDRYPIKISEFTVTVSENVEIKYNLFNVDELDIEFKEQKELGKVRYSWKIKNLDKRIFNSGAPSSPYFAPHIIVRVASYTKNGEKINVSENTDDLFKWYNSLIEKIPESKLHKVALKVSELIDGVSSQEEKVKKIYQWVQSNITYVAFEDGMAGFIPRAAGNVYDKKYGDCKDMANLLTTMLRIADVPAYLTWVGTNAKPYRYEDVPCTITDNHMICAIQDNNEFIFLDPTNTYLEYGKSPQLLQGKEALVRLDAENYKIIQISESDYSSNARKDMLSLSIEGNELIGKVNTQVSGYIKETYHYSQLIKDYNNSKNSIQDFLVIGKKSAVYENMDVEEKEDQVIFAFDGVFKNDVIATGEKLYVNMNLDPSPENYQISDIDHRIHDIQNDYKNIYEYECMLQIPESYSLDFIPENNSVENDQFSFSSIYEQKGNTLIYKKIIITDFLFLKSEQFKSYKQFFTTLLETSQQKITLKKK